MTFGQRIKMLRQERGLSQEELGRMVDVSSRVIGYYEADERFPKSRDTLIAFASAFSVSLDYLLDNPVRSDNTCPSRFCYMKSMNSEQRSAVNQFIGYLRYRERTEAAEAEDADSLAAKYADSGLSTNLIEMIEGWGEEEEAAEDTSEEAAELPAEESGSIEACAEAASEPAPAEEKTAAEADSPEAAEESEPIASANEPVWERIPVPEEAPIEIEDLPELESVADPEEDFTRRTAYDPSNRFFQNEFFVDDFFS